MDVKLRYTVRKRGKLFWQPTAEMRALGFLAKPLGEDGPEAVAEALRLAGKWDETRAAGGEPDTRYPAGSFGAYWDRLRGTKKHPSAWWNAKKLRSREDYERGWKQVDLWRPPGPDGKPGPLPLSHLVINRITTEICENFNLYLTGRPADPARGLPAVPAAVSDRERWRTIKALKILLADAVVRLRLGYASPAAKIRNPQPAGRTEFWLGDQLEDLAAGAAIAGFEGMSLAIDTMWETMFSPVDVRTMRPRQIKRDAGGWYIAGRRQKTDAEFFAAISDALAERLIAYIGRQDRAEVDDTPIFRSRRLDIGNSGGYHLEPIAYKTKDLFAKDFRLVRDIMFPGDERQMLDIRRSANVEADAAGADKKVMGELLANGLDDSRFLEETYTPPTVAKAREVAKLRLVGRARLAREVARVKAS